MTNLAIASFLFALAQVESGGNPHAQNGACVGIYQLEPIFVQEVNRLVGYQRFSESERWSPHDSECMVRIWMADRRKRHPDWGVRELTLAFKRGEKGMKDPTEQDLEHVERVCNTYEKARNDT